MTPAFGVLAVEKKCTITKHTSTILCREDVFSAGNLYGCIRIKRSIGGSLVKEKQLDKEFVEKNKLLFHSV